MNKQLKGELIVRPLVLSNYLAGACASKRVNNFQ